VAFLIAQTRVELLTARIRSFKMRKVKYAIIGAGTAGLSALSAIRNETDSFVMINRGPFGTTCARVGCMPSKALIQSANQFHKRKLFSEFGLKGADILSIDDEAILKRVRRLRDRFTGGVQSGTTDTLEDSQLIKGFAKFIGPNQLEINGEIIEAERIIIATGSRPVLPGSWSISHDKLLTSDEIFELKALPKKVAVIGLGVIGLELGQALSRLGVEVIGFEMQKTLGGLSCPTVVDEAIKILSNEFPIHLGMAAELEETATGVKVKVDGLSVEVDVILASLGRRPNIDRLDLEAAGIKLNERGMPAFNVNTMQIQDLPIFIAGDVNGFRPILHEAAFEGKVAVLNAMAFPEVQAYQRKTSLGIAFSDPEIGFFGVNYQDLDLTETEVASFNLHQNNGRAIVMAEDQGVISLYADKQTKKLIGGELMMPRAEHLTHLLAWAVENEMTVLDLVKMPFYHPVLEEAIQSTINQLFKALYSKEERGISAELTVMP
jgi:dihydrolipoamide dehydrogenase